MFHSSCHSKCCNPCILHCFFLLIFRCFNRDPNHHGNQIGFHWSHTSSLQHLMLSCSNDGHKGSIAQGTTLLLPFIMNLLLELSSSLDYHAGTYSSLSLSLSPLLSVYFYFSVSICLSVSLSFIYIYCTSALLIVLAALCVGKDLVLRLSLCPSFIHSLFIKSLRLSSYSIIFFVVMLFSLLLESFLQLFCSIECHLRHRKPKM